MRYLSPPLIKRSILFSSTWQTYWRPRRLPYCPMLLPTHSDPACTPGQFGDSGFAPHSPASLAAPAQSEFPWITLSSWKNDAIFLWHRWNYRVQIWEHTINDTNKGFSQVFPCKILPVAFQEGLRWQTKKANGSFSCSHWPTSTSKDLDLLEKGASKVVYLPEKFPICGILLKMNLETWPVLAVTCNPTILYETTGLWVVKQLECSLTISSSTKRPQK